MRRLPAGAAVVALLLCPAANARAAEDPVDVAARADVAFAATQLARTVASHPVTAYPFHTAPDGTWITSTATKWTSGFMPGALWLMYQATGDPAWKTRAVNWQNGVKGQATKTNTMDIGFQILDSFGNGHRLTSNSTYKQVALQAAASLATRFDQRIGMIRSWDNPRGAPTTDFRVIVDGLMNLELLFWAARNGGDPAYRTMGLRHALRTLQDHVRADGSVYQLVIYDSSTGAIKAKTTAPGYADESTWARGQAWAVRGFTIAFRETREPALLSAARRTADAYLARLPADFVPPWDFDAPAPAPKDSSAAAIAASALIELARLETDGARAARYLSAAGRMLSVLSGPGYLAAGTANHALLQHATYHFKIGIKDHGAIWGDYFLLEALMGLRAIPPATPALPVKVWRATTGSGSDVAANTIDGDLATRWSASGTPYITYDLGSARPVTKVTVAYGLGDQRASRLRIDTSTNASTWTVRKTAVTSGTTLQPETYDIADTTARYIRIVGLGSAVDSWTRISEVTVR